MTRGYPSPRSVEVLFVTYGGGHVQMVLPVAKRLHQLGQRVSIFALTTAIPIIEASGLPFFTYADLPQFADPAIRACGERLLTDLPSNGVLPAIETQAYLGVNYHDLERKFGIDEAAALWAARGRQAFEPLLTMRETLSDLRPALVVATNSPRSEKAAVEAATDLGIPAVAMVDMFALQEIKWLSRPDFGHHLFVFDESVRQRMVKLGRPENEVTVSGNPAFDTLMDPQVISAGHSLRAARDWGAEGRIVLLSASTPEPALHPFTGEPANPALPRAVEDELRRIVAVDPRFELVIRRHPSEDQSVVVAERITQSVQSEDVSTVIHAVDVVVVTCSTVGLQAYLAGVPVVCVEGSVFNKDAPYAEYGMATPVADLADLRVTLANIVARRHGAGKSAFDGSMASSATLRITDAILEFLQQGRMPTGSDRGSYHSL
jgi:hypothetical protein